MAYIRQYGFVRHLRSTPTAHIVHLKKGKVAHEGVGVAFSFRALTAAISEVPTAENELPLVFHARTIDFQDVAVGATITYRFADPSLAARRIDFAIDTDSGQWISDPLAQVASRITELAQQYALERIATMKLLDLLAAGLPTVRQAMTDGLARPPLSAALWPWSASAPSLRTNCRARSSLPSVRNFWSTRRARTS